jgi:hypothetical protein
MWVGRYGAADRSPADARFTSRAQQSKLIAWRCLIKALNILIFIANRRLGNRREIARQSCNSRLSIFLRYPDLDSKH